MDIGSITLSFDCEGKWGMTDALTEWDVNLTHKNLLNAYEFILETLAVYHISATFAFVGSFTETRKEFLENILPRISSSNYSNWLKYSIDRIKNEKEEGWFMPELLEIIKGYGNHEIATHGYTHIPFDTINASEAHLELELIKEWAIKNKIECTTLVFPRNKIRHQDLLKEIGILGYREKPNSISFPGLPKLISSFAGEVSINQNAENIVTGKPQKIPGGVFLNWRYNLRRYIPEEISMLRYKSMIKDAILRQRVAHFWTHPHNFVTSPETKDLFVRLCAEVYKQRKESDLVIKVQKDHIV